MRPLDYGKPAASQRIPWWVWPGMVAAALALGLILWQIVEPGGPMKFARVIPQVIFGTKSVQNPNGW